MCPISCIQIKKLDFQGCKKCNGCLSSPIRGNYDGMVILAVVTKDILPFSSVSTLDLANVNIRNLDQNLDHERFAVYLETALTTHFMFREVDYCMKCVSTPKVAFAMEEAINSKRLMDPAMMGLLGGSENQDFSEKNKKFPGYAVYLGYRLRRRSLAQMSDNTNLKVGKHLSFLATLTKLQKQKRGKALLLPGLMRSSGSSLLPKNVKDRMNHEVLFGRSTGADQGDGNTDEEHGSWERRFSKDILPGQGTGEYEIEDLEDDEFGTREKGPQINSSVETDKEEMDEGKGEGKEDEVDDEKMLEELENKQLMFKLGTLEDDYKTLRGRIMELQKGENAIDERLLTLEDVVTGINFG